VPAFPPTQHSVIDRIRSDDAGARRVGFGALVEAYWRPSYHYLRLRWTLAPADAEDAVQAFFAAAFERRYVEQFDPAKARFRTFLRLCLDRFVQKDRQAEQAEKRGGATPRLSLDFPGAERDLAAYLVAPALDPDRFFRDETVRDLCRRTVERLRVECDTTGRLRAFEVFSRHDLSDDVATSYAGVASALGLTVSQVTNDLHLARRRFRALAIEELRALVGDGDEFRAEARDLFGVEVGE
jgi:DNA-directed RNA polymerase specialized sigma24 family protein